MTRILKRIHLSWIVIACILHINSGCAKYPEDEIYYSPTFELEIQFVHNGVNVADSVGLFVPEDRNKGCCATIKPDDENISFYLLRERDQHKFKTSSSPGWTYRTKNPQGESIKPVTLLHLQFRDRDTYEWEEERDEVYSLSIRSRKLFNDEDEHKLRFFLHIYFNPYMKINVKKIELEGKEINKEAVLIRYKNDDQVKVSMEWPI